MIGSTKEQNVPLTTKGKNKEEIWIKNLKKIIKKAKKLTNDSTDWNLRINDQIIKENEPQKLGEELTKIKSDEIPIIEIVDVCS